MDKAQTASSVGNAMVRGAANAAAGAAKIFSQLGPFAFPVVAAMVGAAGGAGPEAAPWRRQQGGRSRLPRMSRRRRAPGPCSAPATPNRTASRRSLELMLKNTNRDLEYSQRDGAVAALDRRSDRRALRRDRAPDGRERRHVRHAGLGLGKSSERELRHACWRPCRRRSGQSARSRDWA
jgi:hypothetical protein